ncbi:MAG: hypothetical protein AB8U44_01785, partial [Aaplasma endosymbiont of Hyalomma asiaticum]
VSETLRYESVLLAKKIATTLYNRLFPRIEMVKIQRSITGNRQCNPALTPQKTIRNTIQISSDNLQAVSILSHKFPTIMSNQVKT